jgi:CHAD domain-containing protein
MAESFPKLLSVKKEKVLLAKLLTLQDNLGEIQDLRVHEEILEDTIPCLRSMSATSTITATEELLAQMARRRRKLRKKVIEEVLRA